MLVSVLLPGFGLLANVDPFHGVREIGVKRVHPQDIYTMILLNVFEGDHLHRASAVQHLAEHIRSFFMPVLQNVSVDAKRRVSVRMAVPNSRLLPSGQSGRHRHQSAFRGC